MSQQSAVQTQKAAISDINPVPGVVLQRACACGQHTGGGECESCQQKGATLQRAAISPVPANSRVSAIVNDVLSGPGQPLDAATRTYFEPRFGHDFSQVRVHSDSQAAESARSVNALAYTVGRDVVFGAGQFQPGTTHGNKLLAHELTHTIQQRGQSSLQGKLEVGPANDRYEQEADQQALAVSESRQAAVPSPSTAALIQRQTAPATPTAVPSPLASPGTGSSQTPLTEDLGQTEAVTPQNPRLVGFADKVKSMLLTNLNTYINVTGYWNINSINANDPNFFQKQTEQRGAAAQRAAQVKTILVGLGVPAARIQADSFDESILSQTGSTLNGHVLVAYFPTTPNLKLPDTFAPLQGPPAPTATGTPPQPAQGDSAIIAAVRGAITTVTEGVNIGRGNNRLNIGVSGLTKQLQLGKFGITGSVGWTGTLGLATSYRGLNLSGELASDRWELKLSFPDVDAAPNLADLAHIFQQGELAIGRIAGATSSFHNLKDIPNLTDTIHPYVQPVKDAMEAAKGIGAARPNRIIFGGSLSGPRGNATDAPSPPGIDRPGLELKGTITVTF